ncbi:hypothetical protein ASZ90_016036 [hydrocarbon metagenome]|uniref:Uncharacterized protein n=1 Tax=hydrocarbon metagenome TaxID=938273 RepID=A0A0W8F0B6_9ZZZZ
MHRTGIEVSLVAVAACRWSGPLPSGSFPLHKKPHDSLSGRMHTK